MEVVHHELLEDCLRENKVFLGTASVRDKNRCAQMKSAVDALTQEGFYLKAIDILIKKKNLQMESFQYEEVSSSLETESKLYRRLQNQAVSMQQCQYFKIEFFGKQLDKSLTDELFIFRGLPCYKCSQVLDDLKRIFAKNMGLRRVMDPSDPPTKEDDACWAMIDVVEPLTLKDRREFNVPNDSSTDLSITKDDSELRLVPFQFKDYYR